MKSFIKLSVSVALLFMFCQLKAQKAILPDQLIGEWTKLAQSGTKINDSISLTRNLLEATEDHPRYKFELPDRLIRYFNTKSNSGIISIGESAKWNYDEKTKLLKIFSSRDESYFKIVVVDDKTIKLTCVEKGS